MAAVLRLTAMFLVNFAGVFGMRVSRLARECHTDVTPQALPRRKSDPIEKETEQAARDSSRTTPALTPEVFATGSARCARRVYLELVEGSTRPSTCPPKPERRRRKHEGVLAAVCGKSSLGKARERRIPRIPVREKRELSSSPPADPTGVLGKRRSRALAENDARESHRLFRRTRTSIRGHIAPN
jgi:hypothetical protein